MTPRLSHWGRLERVIVAAIVATSLPACSRSGAAAEAPHAPVAAEERELIDRAAAAFAELRQNPRFSAIDPLLARARGVLIFPRLVKASLIVGGEGGNGVLVAKRADGSWSDPAFYSLGSPSVGLQVGYQEAAVALFIMDESTLTRALQSSVALGGKAGATLGSIDDFGRTKGHVLTADIYQVVDARGAFAGLSLDGYVIGARAARNRRYYGKPVTPRDVLLDGSAPPRPALNLLRALGPYPTHSEGASARSGQ
jgi:SH3 domain-containing YSC84-like protein 1